MKKTPIVRANRLKCGVMVNEMSGSYEESDETLSNIVDNCRFTGERSKEAEVMTEELLKEVTKSSEQWVYTSNVQTLNVAFLGHLTAVLGMSSVIKRHKFEANKRYFGT